MNLEQFKLWKVKPLQEYLRCRNMKTSGSKEELVALVYACHEMNIEPQPSGDEVKKILSKEYADLLVANKQRMPDPFSELKNGWEGEETARTKWPPTMYGDMMEFMSECTVSTDQRKRMLSEYKAGKGFSYFDSKFLKEVFYHPIEDDVQYCYLRAMSTPSQNVNNVPHRAWVLLHKITGRIESAYCTCKAGMFSKCNHVAAILFKVDWVWTLSDKSVTSNPCQWNKPGEKVIHPCKIAEMKVYRPHKEKSGIDRNINSAAKRLFTTQRSRADTPFTLNDWAGILYDKDEKACAFHYAESRTSPLYNPEADQNVDCEEEVNTSSCIPQPLLDTVKDFKSVEAFLNHMDICPVDIIALEEATRDQTSTMWTKQRKGRIGASIAHRCKTKMGILRRKELDVEQQTSVNNVVASVLGTGPDISSIPAVKFGREKEDEARNAYTREHRKCHRHPVNVLKCGLHVHKNYFFLSASPDGLVECECGQGLVEIKCPMSSFGLELKIKFWKKKWGKKGKKVAPYRP